MRKLCDIALLVCNAVTALRVSLADAGEIARATVVAAIATLSVVLDINVSLILIKENGAL